MKLITASNGWNCMLVSAAMVMDCSVQELINYIGHDGSKIINPELKFPGDRKGFHYQELIDAAFKKNFSITPIEAVPVQTATGKDKYLVYSEPSKRFLKYLSRSRGILVGEMPSKYWHAVAWNGKRIYDPQGRIYPILDCKIKLQVYYMFNLILKSK